MSFLRRVLVFDAVISGATGVLMLAGAGFLQERLGLPAALLRYAGLSLLPFAAIVGSLARRERPPRTAVRAVIGLNAAWVAGSVLLLVGGSPSALGTAFILVQAVAVAVFAEMQYVGLRKAGAAMA